MDKLLLKSHKKYFLSIGEDEFTLAIYSDVISEIKKALDEPDGKLSLAADGGSRPLWQRFIFGADKYVHLYFMYEWSGNVSSLIFYDENVSEYRAFSNKRIINLSESDRSQINFGDKTPIEDFLCISKEETQKAIYEFLDTGDRPCWLKYQFVK